MSLPRGTIRKLISEIPCNNSHNDYKYFASIFSKENGKSIMRDLSQTLQTLEHRDSLVVPEE
jgi:hypothetical protein